MGFRQVLRLVAILACLPLGQACPQFCQCPGTSQTEVRCQQAEMRDIMSGLPPKTYKLEVKQTSTNYLTPIHFNSSHNLIELEIYDGYINGIEDKTFYLLNNLQILNLTNNHLRMISKDAFLGLNRLTKLDLSHNNIQSIDEVFYSVDKLQTLYINSNSLTAIPSKAFQALTQLRYLQLDRNEFQSLIGNPFQGLSVSLKMLYMRGCGLNSMSSVLSLRSLNLLDLGENSIFEMPSNSQLRSSFPYLRSLYLDHNKLTRLADGQFSDMNLDTLDLAYNQLDQVTNTLFNRFTVQNLNLSSNVIINIGEKAFQLTKSVGNLNLAHNPIGALSPKVFRNLYALRELNLSECALNGLSDEQFRDIYLIKLDISRNSLPFLSQGLLDHLTMISKFYINGNPWHCDCRIAPLKLWLEQRWRCNAMMNPAECQPPTCMSPDTLAQRPILRLTEADIDTCQSSELSASTDIGMVVGLAVGGVFLLLFVVIIIFILCRRRQNQNKPGGQFHICRSPASDVTSHNEDFEKSSHHHIKPFNDGDQVSIESDKSFVVRHFFETMVSTDPSGMSNQPERMRRDTFRTTYSGSNPSLASSAYSYPIGRETAI